MSGFGRSQMSEGEERVSRSGERKPQARQVWLATVEDRQDSHQLLKELIGQEPLQR